MKLLNVPQWLTTTLQENGINYSVLLDFEKLVTILSAEEINLYNTAQRVLPDNNVHHTQAVILDALQLEFANHVTSGTRNETPIAVPGSGYPNIDVGKVFLYGEQPIRAENIRLTWHPKMLAPDVLGIFWEPVPLVTTASTRAHLINETKLLYRDIFDIVYGGCSTAEFCNMKLFKDYVNILSRSIPVYS